MRSFHQEEERALAAFGASARVDPSAWDDRWGSAIRSQYEIGGIKNPGVAEVEWDPPLGGNGLFVDGNRATSDTAELSAGLHAIQISYPEGVVLYGRVLFFPEFETVTVETGVPTGRVIDTPEPLIEPEAPEPVAPEVPERPPVVRRPIPVLPVFGAGLVVAGAGAMAWSQERRGVMKSTDSPDELVTAWRQHTVASGAGVGLMAGGAACLTAHFVF